MGRPCFTQIVKHRHSRTTPTSDDNTQRANFLPFLQFQDIETFDLEDFKYNSVNITAFRLVDVESVHTVDIMEQMKKFQHSGKDVSNGSSVIMVSLFN